MSPKATIIGDGQMALAMADALVERGAEVRLWGPLPKEAEELAASRVSPRMPDYRVPHAVQVLSDEHAALKNAEFVVSAIPTQFLPQVWQRIAPAVPPDACVISVTKGIEVNSLRRPTEVIQAALADRRPSICTLSGPSIASELVRHLPASLVAASHEEPCARSVQGLLNVGWLRIYRHDDVVGVEIAGATKNVIALAAGMLDGLQAGDNAKSALLARGLAEIARLGLAMGAKIDTFFGIAGVGDLATTCFSPEGRNRTCGERLGRGEKLQDVLASMTSIVEGVETTRAVKELAGRHKVDMPITNAVHAILFENLAPREALRELMGRSLKAEQVG